jgi:hypothetical protein
MNNLYNHRLRNCERLAHLIGQPIEWGAGKKAYMQHLASGEKYVYV